MHVHFNQRSQSWFLSPTDPAGSSWATVTAPLPPPDPRSLPLLLPRGKEVEMSLLPVGRPWFGAGSVKGELSCLLLAVNKLSAHLTMFTLLCPLTHCCS